MKNKRGLPSIILFFLIIDRLYCNPNEYEDISATTNRRFSQHHLENMSKRNIGYDHTIHTNISLNEWMKYNPNIKKLAMFQNEKKIDVKPIMNRVFPSPDDDNFHWQYKEVNSTLFTQTDRPNEEEMMEIAMSTPRRRMPTGRALSDPTNLPEDRIPIKQFDEIPTSTEQVPFEVTPDLMRDLTQIGQLSFISPSTFPPLLPVLSPTPEQINNRRSFYRMPDMIAFREDLTPNKIHGEETNVRSEVINSNTVDEEMPFIGDSTTFEIPTSRPLSSISSTTSIPLIDISFTKSPFTRSTLNYFSQHHQYFSTTETPFIQSKNKDFNSNSTPREELILFKSQSTEEEEMKNKMSTLPSLNPIKYEKIVRSGRNKDKMKKKRRKTKKRNTKRNNVVYRTNGKDRYEVHGTKYYEDNRISSTYRSGKQKNPKEHYGSSNEMGHIVSKGWGRTGDYMNKENDNRFALEMEILRTKKLSDDIKRSSDGIRKKVKRRLHRKYGRTSTFNNRHVMAPISQSHMVSRGNRMVEQRVSVVGGQMVTVDLANPLLHGADLMINPGAIIHGSLESITMNRDKEQIVGDIELRDTIPRHTSQQVNDRKGTAQNTNHYVPEFIRDRILTDIEDTRRIEIETFDGSKLDEPKRCCDDNDIKGEIQNTSLDTILIPLNSDSPRHSQKIGIYSQVNDKTMENSTNITEQEKFIVDECFEKKDNCYLIDASPLERRIGLTVIECLRFCARVKGCLSVSFASTLSICDIYNTKNGIGSSNLVQLLGYMYYEPKTADTSTCMTSSLAHFKSNNTSRARGVKQETLSISTNVFHVYPFDPLVNVNSKRSSFNISLATQYRCYNGEEVLFIRSRGIRDEGGSNLDTVLNINEDDCVFSCISNLAGYYDEFNCLSAQYDSYNEACTLSSDPPRDDRLSLHPTSNFYEKICTKRSVSSRCSGGNVDRKRQKILTGLNRDTITVGTVIECIERCVDVNAQLPFKCLSVLYYYEEETFNCVLNDGSAISHPNSLFDEVSMVVDYFGIDECNGIKEIKHVINQGSNELESIVHTGGSIHKPTKRKSRTLPFQERARI